MEDQLKRRFKEAKEEIRRLKVQFASHLIGCGKSKQVTATELGLSVSRITQMLRDEERRINREYWRTEKAKEIKEQELTIARSVLLMHEHGVPEDQISTIFGYGYTCFGASKEWALGILAQND
jgi:hypothetical protein